MRRAGDSPDSHQWLQVGAGRRTGGRYLGLGAARGARPAPAAHLSSLLFIICARYLGQDARAISNN